MNAHATTRLSRFHRIASVARPGRLAAAGAALAMTAMFAADLVPAAGNKLEPTPGVGSGPNHREGAPYRAKLSPPFARGTVLVIKGHVHASDTGGPISGAILDAFHADADGKYDRRGFNYRARVMTDEDGYFEFETIRPSGYSGLQAHIHFVIDHPAYGAIHTELRFREDLGPAGARGFPEQLLVDLMERESNGHTFKEGIFDIVMVREK